MTNAAEQLKHTLLQLPVRDRAELASFLIRSLGNGEPAGGATHAPKPVSQAAVTRARSGGRHSIEDSARELREKHTAKLREAYAAASAQSLRISEEWQAVDQELDDRLNELEAAQ